jgi:hypothetical protein
MNTTSKAAPLALDQIVQPGEERVRVVGTLDPYSETGTEGIVWSLTASGVPGYDALNCLKRGDGLLVYNPDGTALWSGDIDLEYKRCYQAFPMNPEHGQQAVNGMWVNGLQSDVDPQAWAGWFHAGLPAVAWIKQRQPSQESVAVQRMDKERVLLSLALDAALTDPNAAWALIEKQIPEMAERMKAGLTHKLTYWFKQLRWPVQTIDLTENGVAHTWQIMVALSRASRALGGGLDPWDAMAARWTEGSALEMQNIIETGREEFLYDRSKDRPDLA